MKARGFVSAGVAAAAAVMLCSSPAFAEDKMIYTLDGGGYATWEAGRHIFTVCDQKADGKSPKLEIQSSSGTKYWVYAMNGANTCEDKVNHAVAGLHFKMKVCLVKGSNHNLACSAWTSVKG